MRYLIILLCLISFNVIAEVEQLKIRAAEAAASGDVEQAIQLYGQVVKRGPNDGFSHYRLGSLLMDNKGDLNTAIKHFREAANAGFRVAGVHYRLSRIYARLGRKEEALAELEAATSKGFLQFNLLENEPDYAAIKSSSRFTHAFASIRAARFPCEQDDRHRAFDFWIGEWNVTVSGQFAGTNKITPILGGCALFEEWSSAAGGGGKSFNYFDPGYDHWRQIWIGDNGSFIEFTGKARDGGIFYTAKTINPADKSVTHHKFEFTPNGDGSVRQFWQISPDRGNWSTVWDGHYTRMD